jgi:Oleosin
MTDFRDHQTLQHMKAVAPPKGPSRASHVTALVTLLPLGGTLLGFSGATLACTCVGLAIVTPLFILFSPILVPAALTVGLVVTGFLVAGVMGLAALSAFLWIFSYFRGRRSRPLLAREPLERARKHAAGVPGWGTD